MSGETYVQPGNDYLLGVLRDMRLALVEFRKFDKKRNDANDELDVWLDRSNITDVVQRDKIKRENLRLAGALSGAQWWRDKVTMLSGVVQAERAAKEMLRS